jgi:hypothetical protein
VEIGYPLTLRKNPSQIFFSFDNGNDNLSPKFREVDVMGQIAVFPDVTLGVEDWV